MSQRILVIDHHPQGLSRIVDPLRDAGYDVAVAQTAADGAVCFGNFEPHLVFIAARLPRTHGTVLCRELKRTEAGFHTPIVLIIEGTGVQIDLPPLDQFGADRLLQKPVATEDLLAISTELLSRITVTSEPAAANAARPEDDGLSTALEELDTLDFDLPEKAVRAGDRTTEPPQTALVPLSDDDGEDIENRLDKLFSGDEPTTEVAAEPEPAQPAAQTEQDRQPRPPIVDALDLDDVLDEHIGGTLDGKPSAPTEPPATLPERSPAETPSTRNVTAAVQIRPQASVPVTPRFQTESLTQSRKPVGSTEKQDPSAINSPTRWTWVALPTAALLLTALAIIAWTNRDKQVPPSTNAASSTGTNSTVEGTPSTASVGPALPRSVPAEPEQLPFEPETPETPETAETAETAETETDVVNRRPSTPKNSPEIARVTPDPVQPQPTTIARQVVPLPRVAQPEPAPEPTTTVVEKEPIEVATVAADEPVAMEDPAVPLSAPEPSLTPINLVETILDLTPQLAAPTVAPEPIRPEPITRDPILTQRVDPRVSNKDLRKGGGTIVLSVRVGKTGNVQRVVVKDGMPGSPLESSAVAAVLRWKYEPALDRGEPIEAWAIARFSFGQQ